MFEVDTGGAPPTGASDDAAAPPAAPPTAFDDKWNLPLLREVVTSVIALSIVAAALVMLLVTFFRVAEPTVTAGDVSNMPLLEAQEQARERTFQNRLIVLNVAIGILGVVTGYFFGRVPAERRAEKAEGAAAQASERAETSTAHAAASAKDRDTAQASLAAVKRDAQRTLSTLATRLGPAVEEAQRAPMAGGGGSPSPRQADLLAAQAEVDALLRRLED